MGSDRFRGSEGGSRFRQVPGFRRWFQVSMGSDRFRLGKWLRFRRFWSSGFSWVLTVSKVLEISGFDGVPKVPGPRAAEDMWDQVLAILGLAQCGWQCCAESECICVKRDY